MTAVDLQQAGPELTVQLWGAGRWVKQLGPDVASQLMGVVLQLLDPDALLQQLGVPATVQLSKATGALLALLQQFESSCMQQLLVLVTALQKEYTAGALQPLQPFVVLGQDHQWPIIGTESMDGTAFLHWAVVGRLATSGSWRPALMGMSEGKLANDSV